jgi:hypothetical protein
LQNAFCDGPRWSKASRQLRPITGLRRPLAPYLLFQELDAPMSKWFGERRVRRDVVHIPSIRLAFALSLLIHVGLLWWWLPRSFLLTAKTLEDDAAGGRLQVRLAPAPSPPSASASAPAGVMQTPSTRRSPQRRPELAPAKPQLAGPDTPSIPLSPSVTEAPPARPAPAGDFASYVEARRLARGESAASMNSTPTAEEDNARSRRIVEANLGSGKTPNYGADPGRGGGIFQVVRLGYDDGEFMFFGWNKDIARNATQMISVKRGSNSDMRIALVRKMIEIVRAQERIDFVWASKRLGRPLTLSARIEDTAGLEEFLMREFF